MKEQLIELLKSANTYCPECGEDIGLNRIKAIADHLIANGVTVQKKGCWMLDSSDDQWHCSECGTHAASWDRTKETGGLPMFCHGCGAKMYEDGDSE